MQLSTRTAFRAILLLSPLLLLGTLELLLRVSGVGYPTNLFLPWQQDHTNVWVSNVQFTRRFFPLAYAPQPRAFAFPALKATNTTRIFVLGESAALGEPEPRFGFGNMLKALLRERFPARHFEIVNLGIVAINSHVIRDIARQAQAHHPDLWIIYMGNNEMVGPFGSVTVLGQRVPSMTLGRLSLALKQTRLGQLMDLFAQQLRANSSFRAEWHGMATFQGNRVRWDDALTQRVHQNFELNLRAILESCTITGAPVLLCTVGSNLKDCPPFASMHPPQMSADSLARWQADFERGQAEEAKGRVEAALVSYLAAAKVDDTYAELQFRMGRCLLALGKSDESRTCLEKARDYDALQFRADRWINGAIRRLAASFAESGVRLVDLEQTIAQQSTAQIAGAETFLEHVHFNPEGNYLLARNLARETESVLGSQLNAVAPNHLPEWLSQTSCYEALGISTINRLEILSTILKLVSGPPFDPLQNSNAVQKLKQEIESLRPLAKASRVRITIPELRRLVEKYPEDPDLRWTLADLLETISDYPGAEREWKVITSILPQSALAFLKLGYVQERQGRAEDALISYRTCLKRDATFPQGQEYLGLLLTKAGRNAEAIPHLRQALRARPDAVETRVKLAQALIAEGKRTAADEELNEALRLDPSNGEARQILDQNGRSFGGR